LFHAATLQARSDALDDLLSRLHSHYRDRPITVSRGYASSSPGVGQYLVSRQYDDDNGALYDDEERERLAVIEHAILSIAEPGRSALFAQARALCLGTSAFSSPRLPTDQAERDRILRGAREQLALRLVEAGLL